MKFQDVDGSWKTYNPSFTEEDKKQLEDFIKSHDDIVPMKELGSCEPRMFDTVSIRHDIDHSIKHALKFAKWEHEREIRSTYFILHTAFYNKDTSQLHIYMNELQDLGHEVGLHIDTVSQNIIKGKPDYAAAAEHLLIELSELRKAGFDIVGAAAHSGHKDFSDEELIKIYGLEFFDLQYEAYELQRRLGVNYISDNQGEWRAPLIKIPHRATVISTHPCHWPF